MVMSKMAGMFRRLKPKSPYGPVMLLIFGIALFLRAYPPQGSVFGSGWTKFSEVDPWYHVRLIENLVQHFPHRIVFDPYTFYPCLLYTSDAADDLLCVDL